MTAHRLFPLLSVSALLSACTVSATPFAYDVPAQDVAGLAAQIERGDLTLRGQETDQISIQGESWGRARDEEKAAERQAGNAWTVTLPETSTAPLYISAESDRSSAGVDFDIVSPSALPAEIEVEDGGVYLVDLRGAFEIDASRVELDGVGGMLDIQAGTGGVAGVLDLQEGDEVMIVVHGGAVDLQLPYGPDYDISVWSHPEANVDVDVSGLWVEQAHDGYYTGRGLFGTVRITILSDSGDVTVRDAFSWLD